MPKLYNVTGWNVEAKAMGVEYKIPAFTEVDIYDLHHANHILQKFKKYGVISLEHGPKAQEQYPEFKDYRKFQEVQGLKQALKFKEQNLRDERQAERDLVQHRGPEGYKNMLNVEGFQKEVTLLKKWIVEAGGDIEKKADAKPVVLERPKQEGDRVVKEEPKEVEKQEPVKTDAPRRGRPRKVANGKSRTAKDESSVTA